MTVGRVCPVSPHLLVRQNTWTKFPSLLYLATTRKKTQVLDMSFTFVSYGKLLPNFW
jgi:hypothetical protein